MSSDKLAGRVAVVTGASRGIGASVARRFCAEGAAVTIAHAPTTEMKRQAVELAAELVDGGSRAVTAEADLADPEAIEQLVAQTRDELGPIDILVANAAVQERAPWRAITVDQWDYVQRVNVRATWLLARAAYDDLRRSNHASIITVTSVMVETGQVGALDYTVSKAGIIGLTRALARELGDDDIRVNAVMPGAIRTEYEAAIAPDEAANFDRITALQSLKRRGYADDTAGAFAFLASDDSAFVTGQVLNVDGGWVHY